MTEFRFLFEWAVRSSILILPGLILVLVLRRRDSSMRLSILTAVLFGSIAIPILMKAPRLPVSWNSEPRPLLDMRGAFSHTVAPEEMAAVPATSPAPVRIVFEWTRAAMLLYTAVALFLLVRIAVGLVMSLRLLRASDLADWHEDGIEIRESNRVTAPVTLGIIRPAIVLPPDWRNWESWKLSAVTAHEGSHIRRFDPAVQLLSAIHRAILWFSPLSWFLHSAIVRTSEHASDDAAVLAIGNGTTYAEVLMEFLGKRAGQAGALCMARYGRVEHRLDRILNMPPNARRFTRKGASLLLASLAPVVYLAAAVQPRSSQDQPIARTASNTTSVQAEPQRARAQGTVPPAPRKKIAAASENTPGYLTGLGNVVPSQTVTIRAPISGELKEVNFKEGEAVGKGALLAQISVPEMDMELSLALGNLARDRKELPATPEARAEHENRIRQETLEVERLDAQANRRQIRSPLSGIAGFRVVDVGNMVRVSDPLVVVTQIQPIAVMFTIPEDYVQVLRTQLLRGTGVPVEAWNRDRSAKLATGRLIAMDNAIDTQTGTLKFKAEFENKDNALFPNQFVIVRVAVPAK